MTTQLSYKIIKAVGEEDPKGNAAFDQPEQFVNVHIREGWRPVGGIAVFTIAAPKTAGSIRDNWYVRVAQALIPESVE